MRESAPALNYIVHYEGQKGPGANQILEFTKSDPPSADEHQFLQLCRRTKAEFPGWCLHVWGLTVEECITRPESFFPDGKDEQDILMTIRMFSGEI
jgi:hypothetical protein